MNLSWLEISKFALLKNIKTFRKLLGPTTLAPNIKGNAYGHGILQCAEILKNQVDYFCINSPFEAIKLRKNGIQTPLLMIGYTPLSDLEKMIDLNVDLTIYNQESLEKIISLKKEVNIHLKIETGNHRQGIQIKNLEQWIVKLSKNPQIKVKGVSTHFANLEDRINHAYASHQLQLFKKAVQVLTEGQIKPQYKHCANTAASLMFPEAHFNFIRLGIGTYGLWPSEKTKRSTEKMGLQANLKPVLSWKTIVAQVKEVKKGALIGYGCTHEMKQNGQIAVLPIGYYDGYSRAHSNNGHVLIKGKKAPIIGRICMNMMMVDITHIKGVKLEEEVVLIGKQESEEITTEMMAEWSHTINYEVTTRINERIERIST